MTIRIERALFLFDNKRCLRFLRRCVDNIIVSGDDEYSKLSEKTGMRFKATGKVSTPFAFMGVPMKEKGYKYIAHQLACDNPLKKLSGQMLRSKKAGRYDIKWLGSRS